LTGRDFGEIKARLLQQLANGGQPIIEVVDGNFGNRGELVLRHRHDELDLDIGQAQKSMEHLHRLWTRPVHIETILEGKPTRLTYNGEAHASEPT